MYVLVQNSDTQTHTHTHTLINNKHNGMGLRYFSFLMQALSMTGGRVVQIADFNLNIQIWNQTQTIQNILVHWLC